MKKKSIPTTYCGCSCHDEDGLPVPKAFGKGCEHCNPEQASRGKVQNEYKIGTIIPIPPADVEDEWRCGLLRLCSDIYGSFHWHPKMESFIRDLLQSERKKWESERMEWLKRILPKRKEVESFRIMPWDYVGFNDCRNEILRNAEEDKK